jgi:8-amino-7-oxononanoate synthase
MAFNFIEQDLALRAKQGLLRKRKALSTNKQGIIEFAGKHYINFASNDYLGLSQHEQVLQSYVEGLAMHGCGSGASPIVTGYSSEHEALEDDLCEVLNKPAALLFSSGFAANQAVCDALIGDSKRANQSSVICDKYMHASFIQAALSSPTNLKRFKHNDMQHAKQYITGATGAGNAQKNVLIATEGVFSMDGDLGDVAGLQRILAEQSTVTRDNQPWLMVDDAHAIGVVGENGFGSSDTKGISAKQIDVLMGTFGKALGTSGAFVAGSVEFIEYLVNYSKHYVYSTAFSGAQARATRASIALVAQGAEREKLHANIALFNTLTAQAGLPLSPSLTPIQALIVGEPLLACRMSEKLAELGLWVPAIRQPTVPANTDRLRITLSAIHTELDIRALVDGLSLCYEQLMNASSVNRA